MKPAALILCVALLAWNPQEKITLKSRPKVGDKIISGKKVTMKMDTTITSGGQSQKTTSEHRISEKATIKMLEVEGEKVTKALFHFEEDVVETKKDGKEDVVRQEGPLHGREVTVQQKDGKTTYEGADGLPEMAKKKMKLDSSFSKMFPDRELAVGESWEVAGKALQSFFGNRDMDGKLTAKLAEVKEFEGRRSAFLDLKIDQKISDEEEAATVKLEGTAVVWIERGYLLQLKLRGTVAVQNKAEEEEMNSEGTVTLDIESKVQVPARLIK